MLRRTEVEEFLAVLKIVYIVIVFVVILWVILFIIIFSLEQISLLGWRLLLKGSRCAFLFLFFRAACSVTNRNTDSFLVRLQVFLGLLCRWNVRVVLVTLSVRVEPMCLADR